MVVWFGIAATMTATTSTTLFFVLVQHLLASRSLSTIASFRRPHYDYFHNDHDDDEFYSGKKEKKEFYDPQAKATAVRRTAAAPETKESFTGWGRFADRRTFSDDSVAHLAGQLHCHINQVLFDDAEIEMEPVAGLCHQVAPEDT